MKLGRNRGEDWRKALARRIGLIRTTLTLFQAACAVALLSLGIDGKPTRWSVFFLLMGLWVLHSLIFRLLPHLRWLRLSIPVFVRRDLAFGPAAILTATWYLHTGQSSWFTYVAAGSIPLVAALTFPRMMVAVSSTLSLRQLIAHGARRQSPSGLIPHVIVMRATTGLTLQTRATLFECARGLRALRKFSAREADEEFETHLESRQGAVGTLTLGLESFSRAVMKALFPAALIMWDDVLRHSGEVVPYAIRHAVGIVVLARPKSIAARLRRLTVDRQPNPFLVGNETELYRHAHGTLAPVVLFSELRDAHLAADTDPDHLLRDSTSDGYEVASASVQDFLGPAALIARVVHRTGIPLLESDRRLPPELVRFANDLAREGLAPLADAYLRLRVGGSDVERFLALIDCFEVLIKYSVFLMGVEVPGEGANTDVLASLKDRPSMGDWVQALHSLVKVHGSRGNHRIPFRASAAEIWAGPLAGVPGELVAVVNGTGLVYKSQVPRSHIAWLDWLTWLRNNTKGHGALSDRTAGSVWSYLHEAFLSLAYSLRSITLETRLEVQSSDDVVVAMVGWQRGGLRTSTFDHDPAEVAKVRGFGRAAIAGLHIPLQPWTRFLGSACLTWNRALAKKADYTDYATGRIEQLQTSLGADV